MFTVQQKQMDEWIKEGLSEEEIDERIEELREEWYESLTGIDHLHAYLELGHNDSDEWHFNNGIRYALQHLGLPAPEEEE